MAAVSVRKKKSFARSSKPGVRMCVLDHKEHMSMTSPEPVWPIPMRAIGAQNLLTMPGGVSTSGYLHKKGGSQFSLMKWPLRFIIIHKGCVYYFRSSTSASPQGAFSLNGYNRVMRAAEETTSSNVFPFKIVHFSKKHRTWLFSAASEEERRSWMKHLRREIDHYNDRRESHMPSSDTDSDADSFYGSIERPMEIRHTVNDPDEDYMEEDDDEDEEDYLMPDSSPPHTGRPAGPPPSYPPPPVPALSSKLLQHAKAYPLPSPILRIPTSPLPKILPPSAIPPLPAHKGLAPSPAPAHKGLPPSPASAHKGLPVSPGPAHKGLPPSPAPTHKGLPPSPAPLHKGPPPDIPFASHQQRHGPFSPMTPPLPPPNPRRMLSKPAPPGKSQERPLPVALQIPVSRPLCEQLESRLRLNHAAQGSAHNSTLNHSPANTLSHSPAHSPTHTLSHSTAHSPTHTLSHSTAHSPTHTLSHSPTHTFSHSPAHTISHSSSLGNHCKVQPAAKPELAPTGLRPKPPPPACKPPVPTSRKPTPTSPLGRASPEGQSFRSSADELPADLRSRWDSAKHNGDQSDDDDYENVQLPDSVFVDSTETSFVEKLFRETGDCPDGLYAIRNSGTKTSKVLVVWDISINRARNYRLFEENGCVFLDREQTFPSLAILIEHYYSHSLPQHGSLCLQRPYTNAS